MAIAQDSRRIQTVAFQIWESEGRPEGRDLQHWEEAERLLAVEFRIGYPDATGAEAPAAAGQPDPVSR